VPSWRERAGRRAQERHAATRAPRERARGALARVMQFGAGMSANRGLSSLLLIALAACATAPPARRDAAPSAAMPPTLGPAAWQGPAADAANIGLRAPETPALRALRGRVPLFHLARGPWASERPYEPSYEIALYDDGTLIYEGHRCVKLGGLMLARLGAAEVAALKEQLATSCTGLDTASDDEVWADPGGLRLTCSNGRELLTGSDHCRRTADVGARVVAIADAVLERLPVRAWLGEPTERQGCHAGGADLAPGEIARVLQ
jgi:hypothetical protein